MKAVLYEIIKQEINAWDPIGLLAIGCPKDEYSVEIAVICRYAAVTNKFSAAQLGAVIADTFNCFFGENVFDTSLEECEKIAAKIIDKYISKMSA